MFVLYQMQPVYKRLFSSCIVLHELAKKRTVGTKSHGEYVKNLQSLVFLLCCRTEVYECFSKRFFSI